MAEARCRRAAAIMREAQAFAADAGASVEHAELRISDMTGPAVVVFRHAGDGRINIVDRHRDGQMGWWTRRR